MAIQYPKQALDDFGADFLGRIGVQAIRIGISYIPTTSRDYVSEMEKLKRQLKEYEDKNITVLLPVYNRSSISLLMLDLLYALLQVLENHSSYVV